MHFAARFILGFVFLVFSINSYADEVACQAPHQLRQIAINWAWVEVEKGSTAVVIRKGKELKVKKTHYLESGDRVRGYGELTLHGAEQTVRFFKDFAFEVDIEKKDRQSIFSLRHLEGIAYVLTKKCEQHDCAKIRIQTPTSTVGVRGTEFFIEILTLTNVQSHRQPLEVFYLLSGEIDIFDRKKKKVSLTTAQTLTVNSRSESLVEALTAADRLRLQSLL